MSDGSLPDRAWFTPLLNRIADVAGERAALILGREKAGEQIYIPKEVTSDHWLAELIGLEPAIALAKSFPGDKIVVPPALAGDKRRRAATIAELANKGYSINAIIRLTGLARSTVQEHLKRVKDDRQGSLL